MRISIGADHRGYKLKQQLIPWLQSQGYDVADEGAETTDSVDYPDYALKVANKVSSGQADRGILVCATGVGMCITANKVHGVRATTVADTDVARLSRQHNDVNVICLSGDKLNEPSAEQILDTWLETEFEGGRHAVRVEKIADIEHEQFQPVE
ncbi:MAG TPA: ribose 5-phosphate isomerase B [Pirellulaceae bacterium]|jgi:ribose 5-phosphate isomerase B